MEKADDTNFGEIDRLYEYALDKGYPFYCLTASGDNGINSWIELTGAEYPFCHTDGTTLKDDYSKQSRFIALKRRKVVNKWSHNDFPRDEELKGNLDELAISKPHVASTMTKDIKNLFVVFFTLNSTLYC